MCGPRGRDARVHGRARNAAQYTAHRLIASLDEGEDDDPTEVELAWEEESQRRLDEYRRGDVQAVSSADVFAKANALLK